MDKTIDTLVEDIQALFTEGHECDPVNVAALGQAIAEVVSSRLAEAARPKEPFRLRMSNLGKPDRQLWYDAHPEASPNPEKLDASARIKFLFGDILERMLLFLATEAGHEVTHSQAVVDIEGVRGSMDGRIDGVLVDAKSASTFSYKKFADGSLRRDDSFGYMWQLSGYAHGDKVDGRVTDGAFFVIDKTLGHICLMNVPKEEFELYDVEKRIAHLKEVVASPNPPERCYDEVPDGKSGNMKLDTGCSYCKHKQSCWPNLQTYFYSNGPRFLTVVAREPKVDKE